MEQKARIIRETIERPFSCRALSRATGTINYLFASAFTAITLTVSFVPSVPVVYEAPQIEIIELKHDIEPEMYHLILADFGTSTPQAMDVGWCESNLRQFKKDGTVLRGRVNPADVGVFQINEIIHAKEIARLGLNVHTLEGNIKFAAHLHRKNGWKDWRWSKPCHKLQ